MGKKLDALLGRNFKTSKFKSLANLAISRLAVFKNQRQVKCNQARSDVLQLLEQGHHDRALLRVDHVIKEQNMLDVFVMMEGYCNLLVERLHLIEQDRTCPDELQEAISSLLFASSRCGDFPELQEIRALFTSRYGKEFAARAIELRNNCRVNPKIIQKLSTRRPDLEIRMTVLKDIASESNIVLQLEEASTEENFDATNKGKQPESKTSIDSGTTSKLAESFQTSHLETRNDELSDSMKERKKYRDVADAAQAAFESAAHAAAAARAAVELSRSDPHHPGDQHSPRNRGTKAYDTNEHIKNESESVNQDSPNENDAAKLKAKGEEESKRSDFSSSSESAGPSFKVASMALDEDLVKQLEKDIVFDESDEDDESHENKLKGGIHVSSKSNQQIPSAIQASMNVDSRKGYYAAHAAEGSRIQSSHGMKMKQGPTSVRTRGVRGY